MLSDRTAGIEGLISVIFAVTSIALGTFVGAAIDKTLTEKFGLWQLLIGRVGTYVRRNNTR